MSEQVFLNENGVTVTNARFVVSGAMYPLQGITAVQVVQINHNKGAVYFLAFLLLIITVGLGALGAPAISALVFLGFLWCLYTAIVKMKAVNIVRVATAGGQVDALTSSDPAWIQRVGSALHEAVIHRG